MQARQRGMAGERARGPQSRRAGPATAHHGQLRLRQQRGVTAHIKQGWRVVDGSQQRRVAGITNRQEVRADPVQAGQLDIDIDSGRAAAQGAVQFPRGGCRQAQFTPQGLSAGGQCAG